MRRLRYLDFAEFSLGNESAQIHFVQIKQCDNRCACSDDLARFRSSRDDGPCEGTADDQVLTIRVRFGKLEASLLRACCAVGHFSVVLNQWVTDTGDLRRADIRV